MNITDIAHELEADSAMTLSQASVGCSFRISHLNGASCQRLRSMGFCETMEVKKLSNGRTLLCSVCGTKMALNRKLADQILVCPA
ncbi:FeoA domain-containing protein [Rubritalea squalenifaciens DSM 18772]|uniref:FeoA domain-containing protein n=2 Tax=Rubritalea TaxID=361050 RepID=A0A1M6PF91_9BACT|nr:FeoA family protein [Rubritalea squalenifaciens]SHK06560.1 FeoA domain-containing protein [Rubritalea squalenifaciens DSM 18772]